MLILNAIAPPGAAIRVVVAISSGDSRGGKKPGAIGNTPMVAILTKMTAMIFAA